jgi:hypothetical protein
MAALSSALSTSAAQNTPSTTLRVVPLPRAARGGGCKIAPVAILLWAVSSQLQNKCIFFGALKIGNSAAPSAMRSLSSGRPLRAGPVGMVPLPARGRIKDSVLAARSRPSFCSLQPSERSFASLDQGGKRSAERRMPIMSALRKQVYAVCATHLLRGCAPLSGARPPFGAHACGTRHRLSPRWLSSRTGFPQGTAFGSFARLPQTPCVKHAPCGPVLLPADRGPGAARERSACPPRAGTAACSVLRKCPRERRPLRAR